MAALSGTAGSVVYMTGGTTLVVGIGEWSLDIGADTVETTAFGDSWRTRIAGIRQYSGNLSGRGESDASAATLRNAMMGGSAIALRLYDSATTYYNVTSAFFTGVSPSITFDGRADVSYDFEGNGSLSYV